MINSAGEVSLELREELPEELLETESFIVLTLTAEIEFALNEATTVLILKILREEIITSE